MSSKAAIGKGALGKGGVKRHRKILRDNIQGLVKPSILRLAHRAGNKRVSGLIFEEIRGVAKVNLENFIRLAITVKDYARRKTVQSTDALVAMEMLGVYPAVGLDHNGRLKHFRGVAKREAKAEGKGEAEGKSHRRFHPGTVAIRDAKKQQKNSDNLVFRRLPFNRLVREIMQDFHEDVRATASFIDLAQFYVELKLLRTLRYANRVMVHAKRQTLMPKDIQLARRLQNERA